MLLVIEVVTPRTWAPRRQDRGALPAVMEDHLNVRSASASGSSPTGRIRSESPDRVRQSATNSWIEVRDEALPRTMIAMINLPMAGWKRRGDAATAASGRATPFPAPPQAPTRHRRGGDRGRRIHFAGPRKERGVLLAPLGSALAENVPIRNRGPDASCINYVSPLMAQDNPSEQFSSPGSSKQDEKGRPARVRDDGGHTERSILTRGPAGGIRLLRIHIRLFYEEILKP